MILALLALAAPHWKLVWSDEFNRPGPPDPEKWVFEKGFVRNKELQWYQEPNAFVEKGHLVIEGRREHIWNPPYQSASPDWKLNRKQADYTSAAVETRHLHDWLYGRFEFRAKIDLQQGLWPAIWFLGYGPWPLNGEIDLMEFYQRTMHANLAWGNGTWHTVPTPMTTFTEKDPNWAEKWHVWRMDWDADWIRLYQDGQLLNETDLSKTINPDGTNPFHQPHFILMNLAIGAAGGDPTPLTFPRRFEVDWVRVYQQR